MNRREFFKTVLATGTGIYLGSNHRLLCDPLATRNGIPLEKALFSTPVENGIVQCNICPNSCRLGNLQSGICRTRVNRDGEMFTCATKPVVALMDPIEKAPLFHFLPGTEGLSVATAGCNLTCSYCQNYELSQYSPEEKDFFNFSPEEAVETLKKYKADFITFTYTEPAVYIEFIDKIAPAIRQAGFKILFCSALFINSRPLDRLIQYGDAFSATLKGFNDSFLKKYIGGNLKKFQDSLVQVKKSGKWLEIINLVVPALNDDPAEVKKMCSWIKANLGEDTPLHFGRFTPMFKLKNLLPTPVSVLERCVKIARDEGLKHVYIVNYAPHEANHTYCSNCRTRLIERIGYIIKSNVITPESCCPKCSTRVPGLFS